MTPRELRWVVSGEDPSDLGALLARWGPAAEGALAQGRVFVDGRRATDQQLRLMPGQTVTLTAARREPPDEPVRVLSERDGLLAVYKPAGLSTEPDRRGSDSLCLRVATLRAVPAGEIHACSRLDHGVSGLVLLATTAAARRHAAQQRRQGQIRRRYVAIAGAAPAETRGVWRTPVDEREASTQFGCVETVTSGATLLALEPGTGRKHQLRVHASRAGAPLLGDDAHGGTRRIVQASGAVIEVRRICLHAATLTLGAHRGEAWRIDAPVAGELRAAWEKLGGRSQAWSEALRADFFEPATR